MSITSADVASAQETPGQSQSNGELVGWIMSRVTRWRSVRDTNYQANWERYYAIWRGIWNNNLKTKDAERCKLIAPATQQAVDSTVAEMVEATFGRGNWFDVEDDLPDHDLAKAEALRDQLLEDFDKDKVPGAIREAFVSGAIYGTGIAKRCVEEKTESSYALNSMGDDMQQTDAQRISVYWMPVAPYNFVIDSAAKNVEDALGCAHETVRPIHEVMQKQQTGEYLEGVLGAATGYTTNSLSLTGPNGESLELDPEDGVYITEYHGKVPSRLLAEEPDEMESPLSGMEAIGDELQTTQGEEYTEAIVIIGNGSLMLKKSANPFLGQDRGWVAYQHDLVPNRFWGRGVAEKAYNSQLALDSELRARIDSLALRTYPVMGADITRLPKNLNLKIAPGKTILTHGRPSEIIEPITFGNLDPVSFQQSGDLERMVEKATGAMDPATPADVNSRNGTASGMSMVGGSMLKRAKMTMQNVDMHFLDPIVRKSLIAYMTLDPKRYQQDLTFTVNSAMSIMAREFEQTQMTNLLAVIPPESPAYLVVLKAIVENYSGPSRDKLGAAIDGMMKPDPKQKQLQEAAQMLGIQKLQAEVANEQADAAKTAKEIEKLQAEIQKLIVEAHLADEGLNIDAARVVLEKKQVDVQEDQVAVQREKIASDERKEHIKGQYQKAAAAAKPKPTSK